MHRWEEPLSTHFHLRQSICCRFWAARGSAAQVPVGDFPPYQRNASNFCPPPPSPWREAWRRALDK